MLESAEPTDKLDAELAAAERIALLEQLVALCRHADYPIAERLAALSTIYGMPLSVSEEDNADTQDSADEETPALQQAMDLLDKDDGRPSDRNRLRQLKVRLEAQILSLGPRAARRLHRVGADGLADALETQQNWRHMRLEWHLVREILRDVDPADPVFAQMQNKIALSSGQDLDSMARALEVFGRFAPLSARQVILINAGQWVLSALLTAMPQLAEAISSHDALVQKALGIAIAGALGVTAWYDRQLFAADGINNDPLASLALSPLLRRIRWRQLGDRPELHAMGALGMNIIRHGYSLNLWAALGLGGATKDDGFLTAFMLGLTLYAAEAARSACKRARMIGDVPSVVVSPSSPSPEADK